MTGCVPWPYTGKCDADGQPYQSQTVYITNSCSEYCSEKTVDVCEKTLPQMFDAESVAMTSENKKTCGAFGFKDGTDGMSECLMNETNRRNAEYTARIKARKDIERAQWQAASDSFKQPAQNAPVSRMKSANCVKRYDGSVSCIER